MGASLWTLSRSTYHEHMYDVHLCAQFGDDRLSWWGTFLASGCWTFSMSGTYCRVKSPSLPPIETNEYNLKRYVLVSSKLVGWRVLGTLALRKIEVRCGIDPLYLAPLAPAERRVSAAGASDQDWKCFGYVSLRWAMSEAAGIYRRGNHIGS